MRWRLVLAVVATIAASSFVFAVGCAQGTTLDEAPGGYAGGGGSAGDDATGADDVAPGDDAGVDRGAGGDDAGGGDDASGDVSFDGTADASFDVVLDFSIDSSHDAGRDVGVDVGIDVGRDVGIDVGRDVGVDTGVDASFPIIPCCGASDCPLLQTCGSSGICAGILDIAHLSMCDATQCNRYCSQCPNVKPDGGGTYVGGACYSPFPLLFPPVCECSQ